MIACDTHVLFPALEASHPSHGPARAWLESMVEVGEFALCELVLMEVYTLLRNPVVCARPLNASEAVRKIKQPPLDSPRLPGTGSDGRGVAACPHERVGSPHL